VQVRQDVFGGVLQKLGLGVKGEQGSGTPTSIRTAILSTPAPPPALRKPCDRQYLVGHDATWSLGVNRLARPASEERGSKRRPYRDPGFVEPRLKLADQSETLPLGAGSSHRYGVAELDHGGIVWLLLQRRRRSKGVAYDGDLASRGAERGLDQRIARLRELAFEEGDPFPLQLA